MNIRIARHTSITLTLLILVTVKSKSVSSLEFDEIYFKSGTQNYVSCAETHLECPVPGRDDINVEDYDLPLAPVCCDVISRASGLGGLRLCNSFENHDGEGC